MTRAARATQATIAPVISGVAVKLGRALLVVPLATTLAAWGGGPKCGDDVVRQGLARALDDVFAESRRVAQVGVDVNDIVAVEQQARRASCKAMLHISMNYMNIQRAEKDVVIEYLAETTESGRVLVTITTRP